jgi:type I restriction enzyme, S subunit
MTELPEKIQQSYGRLPKGWLLEKLKFFVDVRNSNVDKTISDDEQPIQLCNYTDVYYNDRITPDMDFSNGSATEAEIEKFQLKRDQVIITKDSEGWDDIGIPALVTDDMPDVLCGYHLSVLEPGQAIEGAFLAWLCRSEPLNDQFKLGANGVTRYGLGQYPLKNAFIAVPPLKTQRRIAQFLNEKTARIDALIEKKRALLDRLAEKRQALITRAVTKGLNPDAPMKPSGIDWLGDIPAHWDIAAVGYRYEVQLGRMLNAERSSGDNLKPYLRVFDVQWGDINIDDLPLMDFPPEAQKRYRLDSGDLLVNEGGSYVGRSAIWRGQLEECYYQKALHRLRAIDCNKDTAEYLYFVMEAATTNSVFVVGGNQTTIDHLTAEQLRRYRFGFPPSEEQHHIAKILTKNLDEVNRVGNRINESIARLKEYRSALITAAVTGQLEVA